jgi:hypothetical protein
MYSGISLKQRENVNTMPFLCYSYKYYRRYSKSRALQTTDSLVGLCASYYTDFYCAIFGIGYTNFCTLYTRVIGFFYYRSTSERRDTYRYDTCCKQAIHRLFEQRWILRKYINYFFWNLSVDRQY